MILVLGGTGFLGKAVCHKLDQLGREYKSISRRIDGFNLRDTDDTIALFDEVGPDYVINCAAYVGGIQFGYKHPGELFYNNMMMTLNILDACVRYGVKRLVNPISNCAYPANQVYFQEYKLWDGPLHESVMVYGLARKASWVGSWAYNKQYGLDTVNLILPNMFGPGDHFEEERSHALGALVMKIVDASRNDFPTVTIWGSGTPVREWMYVDDGANAMVKALDIAPYADPINVGIGKGISIKDLAEMIKDIVGYEGELVYDLSKPNGASFKTMDGTLGRTLLGWEPAYALKEGIIETIWGYMHK